MLDLNQITTIENINRNVMMDKIEEEEELSTNNLYFETRSSELNPTAKAELDKIKELLQLNPTIVVQCIGHTDNTEANADKLSIDRAKAVSKYLYESGLSDNNMEKPLGMGSTDPDNTDNSEEGRKLNRRVTIKVVSFEPIDDHH